MKKVWVTNLKNIFRLISLLLVTVCCQSRAVSQVDLRGKTPEEASMVISVNKPSGATNGILTLSTYDADFPTEGELIINGNKSVPLFGLLGVKDNDQKSANITINTPAAHWINGSNTLRFKHINTVGFVVNNASVKFEAVEGGGSGGEFPLDLQGVSPEEKSIIISVNKPSGAADGMLTVTTYDADFPTEGELIINGNKPVPLFGSSGVKANDQNSADLTISTPAAYWVNGNNTLRFRHTATVGFIIDDARVSFNSVNSPPSVSGASFPVDLRGKTPEEKTITLNVSKPSNAGYCVVKLATYDADFPDEGELVINGNSPIKLFRASGVKGNDQNSADVFISTPASYWNTGNNSLRFRHTNTSGFVVDSVSASFKASSIKNIDKNDPGIQRYHDFNSESLHTYDESDIKLKWGSNTNGLQPNAVKIVRDPDSSGSHGNAMQVFYAANKIGYAGNSGSTWPAKINGSHSEIYLSYDVFFAADAQFVLGGKLPGLYGGVLPDAGKTVDGTDGWSGRIMWHKNGSLAQYVYHANKPTQWGDNLPWDDGKNGQVYLTKGQWNRLEVRYVMNTPGVLNGRVQAWLNGELALDRTDVMFRMPGGANVGIDTLSFSTFYGGNTQDWAPSKNQYIYFDNIVVSTNPISH